jgi:microcystin-dependent protein
MEGLFLGQIVLNAGRITPSGWHVCDGTLLPTMQYAGLYSVLGNKYGGDGMTTFGLPKLPDVGGAAYIIALEGSYPA